MRYQTFLLTLPCARLQSGLDGLKSALRYAEKLRTDAELFDSPCQLRSFSAPAPELWIPETRELWLHPNEYVLTVCRRGHVVCFNFLNLSICLFVCLFLLWKPPSPEAAGITVAAPGTLAPSV